MIQHTAAPTERIAPAYYLVKCHNGKHEQVVSKIMPDTGFTGLCRTHRTPEDITYEQLPSWVLRGMMEAIGAILVARAEAGV
jgi:hypothetical protein